MMMRWAAAWLVHAAAAQDVAHCIVGGFRTLGEPEVHIKMREKFIDGVGGTNVELFLYVDLGVELSAVLPSACTNQVSWRLDATRTPLTRRLLDGVAVRICTRSLVDLRTEGQLDRTFANRARPGGALPAVRFQHLRTATNAAAARLQSDGRAAPPTPRRGDKVRGAVHGPILQVGAVLRHGDAGGEEAWEKFRLDNKTSSRHALAPDGAPYRHATAGALLERRPPALPASK